MRNLSLISIAALFLLAGCNDAKKPSNANFTVAISQYLAKHGHACTLIGQFPIDVPRSEQNDPSGMAVKLAAFEQAGLMHETDATAVVHTMLDSLRGSTPPQPVKRYDLTEEGKKFVRQIPGAFGQTIRLCYGQKNVDSIVRWSEPATAGPHSQSEMVYTYKLLDLASRAQRPDVQAAVPEIKAAIRGQSKTDQVIGLQLTDKGWYVPER